MSVSKCWIFMFGWTFPLSFNFPRVWLLNNHIECLLVLIIIKFSLSKLTIKLTVNSLCTVSVLNSDQACQKIQLILPVYEAMFLCDKTRLRIIIYSTFTEKSVTHIISFICTSFVFNSCANACCLCQNAKKKLSSVFALFQPKSHITYRHKYAFRPHIVGNSQKNLHRAKIRVYSHFYFSVKCKQRCTHSSRSGTNNASSTLWVVKQKRSYWE